MYGFRSRVIGGVPVFGIGPMELIVILVLALIVLGPTRFPEAGRSVGKAVREFRSMTDGLTRELKDSFDDPPPPPRRTSTHTVDRPGPEPQLDDRPWTETEVIRPKPHSERDDTP
jgi:TatA/E family protein of Tat protein translocase